MSVVHISNTEFSFTGKTWFEFIDTEQNRWMWDAIMLFISKFADTQGMHDIIKAKFYDDTIRTMWFEIISTDETTMQVKQVDLDTNFTYYWRLTYYSNKITSTPQHD